VNPEEDKVPMGGHSNHHLTADLKKGEIKSQSEE